MTVYVCNSIRVHKALEGLLAILDHPVQRATRETLENEVWLVRREGEEFLVSRESQEQLEQR